MHLLPCAHATLAGHPDDPLSCASVPQLRRAAGAGVVLDFCLTSVTFHPLDSLSSATRGRRRGHRRQGRRARPGQTRSPPLRELGVGAVRGDFGTTVTGQPVSRRAVAPDRGQPAAGGHRLGAGHRRSASSSAPGARSASTGCRDRVITVLSLLILSTPTFVIANLLILGALRVNIVRSACSCSSTPARPHRMPSAASGTSSSTACSIWCCPRSRWRWARSRVQPLPAQRDARRARPGLHPHRARQGPDPPAGAVQTRPAHGADPDGHAVRLRRRRPGHRRGVRREDLRLARHGRVGGPGRLDPGHQHRRGDHPVHRRRRSCSPGCCPTSSTRRWTRGCGCRDRSGATAETASAKSGVHAATFTSRRTLVLRRFLRNRPAVVALVLLVLLFVGCYALPPLLPYSLHRSRLLRAAAAAEHPRTGSAPTRWARTCSRRPCAACRSRC